MNKSSGLPRRKKPSRLDSYLDRIRELAAVGMTCPEIVSVLNLPVAPEQVRRQMILHKIPLLAKRGAQPGPKHRDWKGGKTIDKDGYILVLVKDHPFANHAGYVREHRIVMEKSIGRFLDPKEVVHHQNGNHQDNCIENLVLFSKNSDHLKYELAGKVPNWSPEGRERTQEANRQRKAAKGFANLD